MMATKVEHVMSYHHQQQLRNKFDLFPNIKLHRRAQVSKYATILEGRTSVGIHCIFKLKGSSCVQLMFLVIRTSIENLPLK